MITRRFPVTRFTAMPAAVFLVGGLALNPAAHCAHEIIGCEETPHIHNERPLAPGVDFSMSDVGSMGATATADTGTFIIQGPYGPIILGD